MIDIKNLIKQRDDFAHEMNTAVLYISKKKYSREKTLRYLSNGIIDKGRNLSDSIFEFIAENIEGWADEKYFNFVVEFLNIFYDSYYMEKYNSKKFNDLEPVWFTEMNSVLLSYINSLKDAQSGIELCYALALYSLEKKVTGKKFENLCKELPLSGTGYFFSKIGYIRDEGSHDYFSELFSGCDGEIDDVNDTPLQNDFFKYLDEKKLQVSSLSESLKETISLSSRKYIQDHLESYHSAAIRLLNDSIPEGKGAEAVEFIADIERRKRLEIKKIEEKYSSEFAAGILERAGNPELLTKAIAENLDIIGTAHVITSNRIDELFELLKSGPAIEDPVLSEIRKGCFLFSDIENLDDRCIQKILREIDSHDLAVALKNAGPGVLEAVLRNMSYRSAELIKEDMEFMGIIKETEIKECRDKIQGIGNTLLAAGEIFL